MPQSVTFYTSRDALVRIAGQMRSVEKGTDYHILQNVGPCDAICPVEDASVDIMAILTEYTKKLGAPVKTCYTQS
jgi:hypothetical protein